MGWSQLIKHIDKGKIKSQLPIQCAIQATVALPIFTAQHQTIQLVTQEINIA